MRCDRNWFSSQIFLSDILRLSPLNRCEIENTWNTRCVDAVILIFHLSFAHSLVCCDFIDRHEEFALLTDRLRWKRKTVPRFNWDEHVLLSKWKRFYWCEKKKCQRNNSKKWRKTISERRASHTSRVRGRKLFVRYLTSTTKTKRNFIWNRTQRRFSIRAVMSAN